MERERVIQQQSPVEREEAEIPVLPQEIMVEILSRLPVKVLCQFRCVSKQWLSLILDPLLAKSHLKQTIRNDCFYSQRKRVIISSHNLYSLEYESIGRNGRTDENLVASELDYPLKDEPNGMVQLLDSASDGFLYCESSEEDNDESGVLFLPFSVNQRNWIDIFGSCNGLVCIAPDEDTLYLFNPTTRESKRIPDLSSGFGPNDRSVSSLGFGSINDDYKVVKVCCGTVWVYSLRADSWRMVCSFPYSDDVYESGVLLNGAIHWMASHGDGVDDKCVVAAFSLKDEAFSDMPAPDIVDTSFEFVVGVLNGCLCVLHSRNQMHNDFWVMTEYGVGESWTKLILSLSYICMKPLCLAQNGEALLQVDGKLLLYNLEDDSYRYLVVDGIPEGDGFEADTYLETLISPNGFYWT